MDSLPLTCVCNCKNRIKKNIVTQDDIEVEYSLFCANCGTYLGTFMYGCWEY